MKLVPIGNLLPNSLAYRRVAGEAAEFHHLVEAGADHPEGGSFEAARLKWNPKIYGKFEPVEAGIKMNAQWRHPRAPFDQRRIGVDATRSGVGVNRIISIENSCQQFVMSFVKQVFMKIH